MTSPERSPKMIQRQGLTLTLWWQHLELLALLTLPPSHCALLASSRRVCRTTCSFVEVNLDEDWLTRHLHGD